MVVTVTIVPCPSNSPTGLQCCVMSSQPQNLRVYSQETLKASMLSVCWCRVEVSGERCCMRWRGQRATTSPTALKEANTSQTEPPYSRKTIRPTHSFCV